MTALRRQHRSVSLIHNTTRQQDPTRTITLRSRYASDARRRLRQLKTAIKNKIVDQNFLNPITTNAFRYEYIDDKVNDFMDWLILMQSQGLLELIQIPGVYPQSLSPRPWADMYIWSAYQRGIAQSRNDLRNLGMSVPMTTGAVGALTFGWNAPVHSEAVRVLYTRNFAQLKGITDDMDKEMSRILAQGLIDGTNPRQIARNLNNVVDRIGINRANLISRTETINAFNTASLNDLELMQNFLGEDILVQWLTALDERVRSHHRVRHGKIYRREDARRLIGEPNCLIGTTMVHCLSGHERTFERRYDGSVVVLNGASGNQLTCTPNHPVLTDRGLIAAGKLQKGDNLLCCALSNFAKCVGKDEKDMVSSIEQVVRSSSLSFDEAFVPGLPSNFHGDGIDSEVTVVRSNRFLMGDSFDSKFSELGGKFKFLFRSVLDFFGPCFRSFFLFRERNFSAFSRFMRVFDLIGSLGFCHLAPFNEFCFALGSGGDVVLSEDSVDDTSIASKKFGEGINRISRFVFTDQLVSVEFKSFHGDVFNLQTEYGFYLASDNPLSHKRGECNTYITGNCRCGIPPYLPSIEGEVTEEQWGIVNPMQGR